MGNNPRLKLHAFPFVVNKFFTLILSNTPLIHRDDNRIVVICFLPQKKRIRALCKCFLLVAQRSTLPFMHFIFWRTDVFFCGRIFDPRFFRCLLAFMCVLDQREGEDLLYICTTCDCDMALHIYKRIKYMSCKPHSVRE